MRFMKHVIKGKPKVEYYLQIMTVIIITFLK